MRSCRSCLLDHSSEVRRASARALVRCGGGDAAAVAGVQEVTAAEPALAAPPYEARRTTAALQEFIAVRVFWITVEDRRVGGPWCAAAVGARCRTLRYGVTASWPVAVGRGLRGSSRTIRVRQSSRRRRTYRQPLSRWRRRIPSVGGRGDDVPGCRLACSLVGRRGRIRRR